jgi:hypothetical protein
MPEMPEPGRMEVPEIVKRIRIFNRKFPLEAVQAAIAQREEVTPALLGILEEVSERGAAVGEEYIAHIYAMFLLAQFREVRAYPLVVRIALLPAKEVDELLGDFITSGFGSVLASVCGGDPLPIQSIVECEAAYEWIRVAAIEGLVTLVNAGLASRDEVVAFFAGLFRGRLPRTLENEVLWSFLVLAATELHPRELMADIEQAYADDLIDLQVLTLNDVRSDEAMGREAVMARLATDPHRQLIRDTVEEYGRWACFQPPEYRGVRHSDDDEVDELPAWLPRDDYQPELPYRREGPKIGRNDPCPCGSGKKYKKCCGR